MWEEAMFQKEGVAVAYQLVMIKVQLYNQKPLFSYIYIYIEC